MAALHAARLTPPQSLVACRRGGHGRTGTLAAVVLSRLYGLSADEALVYTQALHDVRRNPQGVRSPQVRCLSRGGTHHPGYGRPGHRSPCFGGRALRRAVVKRHASARTHAASALELHWDTTMNSIPCCARSSHLQTQVQVDQVRRVLSEPVGARARSYRWPARPLTPEAPGGRVAAVRLRAGATVPAPGTAAPDSRKLAAPHGSAINAAARAGLPVSAADS